MERSHPWQEAQGEILAVMDGDLQHPPETLALLIEALEKQGGYRGSESACAGWWGKQVEYLSAWDLVGGYPCGLVDAPRHSDHGARSHVWLFRYTPVSH